VLQVLIKDAADTKVDIDVAKMLTMEQGQDKVDEPQCGYSVKELKEAEGMWWYAAENATSD
jgi:hypothetical protein